MVGRSKGETLVGRDGNQLNFSRDREGFAITVNDYRKPSADARVPPFCLAAKFPEGLGHK